MQPLTIVTNKLNDFVNVIIIFWTVYYTNSFMGYFVGVIWHYIKYMCGFLVAWPKNELEWWLSNPSQKQTFFFFFLFSQLPVKQARSVRYHVSSAELHLRSWERFLHPLNHLFTKQVEPEFWTRMNNLEPQVFGVSALELAIPPHMASLFMQALHMIVIHQLQESLREHQVWKNY